MLPGKLFQIGKTEKVILIVFGLQAIIAFLIGIFHGFWLAYYRQSYEPFIGAHSNSLFEAIRTMLTVLVLTSSAVPISLFICWEIVRLCQAYFIEHDEDMADKYTRNHSRVLDSNLNDELGIVDQIFCDKTGTLTRNILDLKVCTIGGEVYGDLSFLSSKKSQKMASKSS